MGQLNPYRRKIALGKRQKEVKEGMDELPVGVKPGPGRSNSWSKTWPLRIYSRPGTFVEVRAVPYSTCTQGTSSGFQNATYSLDLI